MNWLNYFEQALVNIRSAKLRSFLALLGILVGTAAVVALLNCGQLATEKALEQFKALGTDLLSVSAYPKSQNKGNQTNSQISLDIWRKIPEKIPEVLAIAPYSTAYQPLSFLGKPLTGAIIGADETLASIINIKLQSGHFVSFVETYEHFCVIGDLIYKQLKRMTLEDPLGKQIRIGPHLYTIIGIAKPWKENSFFNEDINQAVIIPISGVPLIHKESKVNNAVILLKKEIKIDQIILNLKNFLQLNAPTINVFTRSAKQIIASMESQGQIFTLLLAVIGGISLLVGGIGVMNVMLVSVSERKKEIGIRKAIGAKSSEIQALFIMESVLLSCLGGVLGVVLGLIFTFVVAYFSEWPFMIFFLPPLAGFVVSVGTGVFFGFYPARRAAKLEPMVSLRSE